MDFRNVRRDGAATVALVLAVAIGLSPIAHAADADDLIRQGVALRRRGDDAGALRLFQQAYQITPSAKAMAQIGMAEQATGRWVGAYEHLQQAVTTTGDNWIDKNRVAIQSALTRVSDHVGQLEIRGGSPDAEVRVEGVLRGTLPLPHPLAVTTGKNTIDLTLPGHNPVQRVTVVGAHEDIREFFDPLVSATAVYGAPTATKTDEPRAASVPAGAGSPEISHAESAAGTGEAPGVVATATEAPPLSGADNSTGTFRSKAKWVAWGAGTLALAVGVFGAIRQDQSGNDFASGCAIDPDQNIVALPGSNKSAGQCRSLKDGVDSNYRLEVGGLVAAGALAVTGVVLWLTEPEPTRDSAAAFVCRPGVTATREPWLGCAVRF